jgi:hypothetical protein
VHPSFTSFPIGNIASLPFAVTPPAVTSIAATTDNGASNLDAGHVVTITLDTSDIVTVSGTPTLQLNDNEVATYQSGTGSNALTFTYTVQPGDNVADLQVTGLSLPNGASIQDLADNALTGGVAQDLALQIDTTQYWITGRSGDWSTAADWVSGVVPGSTDGAVITSSNVTVNGTAVAYSLGLNNSTLTDSGTLTLGTSLTVDGGASFTLSGGTLSAQSISSSTAGYLSGYGTVGGAVSGAVRINADGGTLMVQGSLAADQSVFLIDGGATLELSNGTAQPVYFEGNPATLKLDAPAAFTGSINNIGVGDKIDLAGITASFATYSGTTLTINETNGQQLTYNNVTGSVAGDTVQVASDNNGGTLVYWGTAPAATSISATTDNGATDINAGHVLTITVGTSEAVTVTGTPTLQLNDNEVATYLRGAGTSALTFTYTVQPGDNTADLQVTGLNLPNGAKIEDGAGNGLTGSVAQDLALNRHHASDTDADSQ